MCCAGRPLGAPAELRREGKMPELMVLRSVASTAARSSAVGVSTTTPTVTLVSLACRSIRRAPEAAAPKPACSAQLAV